MMKKFLSLLSAAALIVSCAAAESAVMDCNGGAALVYPAEGTEYYAEPAQGTITLSFDANITTGYEWTAEILSGDAVEIDEAGSGYVSDPNPDMLDGVGGTHYFKLNALKSGVSQIRFVWARGGVEVAEEVLLQIIVTDDLTIYAVDTTEKGIYVGMSNPWTEMDSLEALNEATDLNLQLPAVMGVTDQAYRLLSADDLLIAEVDFAVNGQAFTLRGSPSFDQDISGIYLEDGTTAFQGLENEGETFVITEDVKAARWMDINGQYVLMADDPAAIDEETFSLMAEELMNLTKAFQPVVLPEGTYDDETSGRAHAEVKALGNDTYALEIHWADYAFEDYVWTMTAEMSEDGLLTYSDCVKKRVVTGEDGTQSEYEADLIPDGYFVPADNAFSWDGAAEEDCRSCRFVFSEE